MTFFAIFFICIIILFYPMVEIGFHTKYILKKMWCRKFFTQKLYVNFISQIITKKLQVTHWIKHDILKSKM